MKLLKLRLSNLNSLYGEWSIDFEHTAYATNGLFAITGPTGAGKSTLLDAISLALYGRTPRLGIISNSTNEIMSRDCGECFAEVTFESSKGRFCAHWSQRRARSKSGGNLQAPQHELIDIVSQRVLTAKKGETQALIQECVGLDYEQFMRSIMLAQGEFATFLKSEDSKRAAILAKITGTDIYARIGTAVYQRFRSEMDSLQLISAQASAIELLSELAIVDLNDRIDELSVSLNALGETRKSIEIIVQWFERLKLLSDEIIQLHEQFRRAKIAVDAANPLRLSLEKAQRASVFRRSLESRNSLQSRIAAAEKLLEGTKAELVETEREKTLTLGRIEMSEGEIAELQTRIDASRPLWLETQNLDYQISNAESNLTKSQEKSVSISAKHHDLQNAKHQLVRKLQGTIDSLTQLRRYRTELSSISCNLSGTKVNRPDVEEPLAIAEYDVAQMETAIDEIEERRSEALDGMTAEELQNECEAARNSCQAFIECVARLESILAMEKELADKAEERQVLQKTVLECCQNRTAIDQQIQQQSQLVSSFEASLLKDQLIASLQEHRSRLVTGQPCELCGSTNHPWSNGGQAPAMGDSEKALTNAKLGLAQFIAHREETNRVVDRNEHLLAQVEERIHALTESLQIARSTWSEFTSRNALDSNISTESLESGQQSIEQFKLRAACLSKRQRDANSLLELVAKLRGELAELLAKKAITEQAVQAIVNHQQNLDQSNLEWQACEATCKSQSDELEKLRCQRNELFGNRNPKDAEFEMHEKLRKQKEALAHFSSEYEPMMEAWQSLDRKVLQIEASLLNDLQEWNRQQEKLDVDLQLAGFVDIRDLESSIKSESEIEDWKNQLVSIDEALNVSAARVLHKETERDEWKSKNLSDESIESLQQQLAEFDGRTEGMLRERMELEHRLSENQKKAEQLRENQLRFASQQQQSQRWSILSDLIGSADGAKFRRFAQGITFELLLAYANIQLKKLTDRYLLKKGDEGLSLDIVDHYQSSRSRSVSNLSGGESFLVSLALALGLSKLASQNVQIDSLFIDEGFGTLDEETLDEALHTLSNLRQEGKLVGLISHVAALHQQIPVCIEVVKGPLGRSRLRGPGVK